MVFAGHQELNSMRGATSRCVIGVSAVNHRRRRFVCFAVGGIATLAMSLAARAQSYPSRPVRIVVGFAAGGTSDIGARLIGQWLQERLGQPFVIENRPGA